MKHHLVCYLFCLSLGSPSCSSLPLHDDLGDFNRFVKEREACEHFGGEIPDPPDPQRLKEILGQMQIYCDGTDSRLAALKVKYAAKPEIMIKLNTYEASIESP
jgi:hypothetical protein